MIKQLIQPLRSKLDRWVRTICVILSLLCFLYYITVGVMVGFGVSLLFVWILLGMLLGATAVCFPALRIRWRKLKKPIRIVGTVALLLIIFFVCMVAGLIFSGFFTDISDSSEIDCLIILGAQVKSDHPSLALARRIDAAYEYLHAHPNTIAIASGGQGADEPISEAQCIYDYLVERGISPDRIILEDQSTSTAENLQNSARLIPNNCQRVAIVTSNFHAFRGQRTALNYMPDKKIYRLPASFPLYLLPHYMVREFAAVIVDTLRGNLKLV